MKRQKYKRSKQREEILKIMQNTDSHPTASWVYDELKKKFWNLSMGTVYRNINILIDQKLVKKVQSGSSFDRFDANTELHYHFHCRSCDTIQDLPLPFMEELDHKVNLSTGFLAEEHSIYFHGLCPACRAEQAQ